MPKTKVTPTTKKKVKRITKLVRISGVTPFILDYPENKDMMKAIQKRVPFDGLWTKTGKCTRKMRVSNWTNTGMTIQDAIDVLKTIKNKKQKICIEQNGHIFNVKGIFTDSGADLATGLYPGSPT